MAELEELLMVSMDFDDVFIDDMFDTDDVFVDDMFDTDDVSYNHEIDHNPKPEDTCRIKVYVSPTLEVATPEEDMQVSFDEMSTIDIVRFRPAREFAVESLSRKIYKKTTTSSFDMCTICLDEFKMGERVVTLPCGHEFDDRCILQWFATSHVCPLCRFELPCEN
ncbi:unnamed protein product [Arabis nemorensis]|uniref:RING-type domain-containing protein n=1 Tax=Arabis nemorensis TaxID=586526 RepID=A0A565AU00_9BRAS|nr:unnamed protein product [Arabis nemorensis]